MKQGLLLWNRRPLFPGHETDSVSLLHHRPGDEIAQGHSFRHCTFISILSKDTHSITTYERRLVRNIRSDWSHLLLVTTSGGDIVVLDTVDSTAYTPQPGQGQFSEQGADSFNVDKKQHQNTIVE